MRRGGTVCGAVSLTVIFCVLCMAVFAALTFVTANRERALSELDAQRAAEFYRADRDATRIAAALRDGDAARIEAALRGVARDVSADAPEAADIDGGASPQIRYTETDAGTLAEFSLPAGGEQRLDVRLLLRDGGMQVQQWKKVYAGVWETEDTILLADIGDMMTLAEID